MDKKRMLELAGVETINEMFYFDGTKAGGESKGSQEPRDRAQDAQTFHNGLLKVKEGFDEMIPVFMRLQIRDKDHVTLQNAYLTVEKLLHDFKNRSHG